VSVTVLVLSIRMSWVEIVVEDEVLIEIVVEGEVSVVEIVEDEVSVETVVEDEVSVETVVEDEVSVETVVEDEVSVETVEASVETAEVSAETAVEDAVPISLDWFDSLYLADPIQISVSLFYSNPTHCLSSSWTSEFSSNRPFW